MTEPVKRYAMHYAEVDGDDGLYPDPTGDWCRYEPRFDAPQLSRDEVTAIAWASNCTSNNLDGADETPDWAHARLALLDQLITRLRAIRPEPPGKL